MDKTRAMPILASAVMALSLTACQGMGGRDAQTSSAQTSSTQTSSGQTSSTQAGRSMAAEQQAVAPDLVRDVQRTLGAKGYDPGTPDGIYGASTEQALRRFQRDQRLNATGQLDTQTLAALGLTSDAQAGQRAGAGGSSYTPTTRRQGAMAPSPQSSARQTASVRHSPDQVRNIQQNLTDRGYNPGELDGRWGPQTQQALRNFERDQNLQADGRPDPQTLAALGIETGSPATQTGAMPPERMQTQPSPERSERELEGFREQEQGLLPDTGEEAPGSAQPSERMGGIQGTEPDTGQGITEEPGPMVSPAPAPAPNEPR